MSCWVGLWHPKYAVNVGMVLRTMGCFGSDKLVLAGHRFVPSRADTRRMERRLPIVEINDFPADRFRLFPDKLPYPGRQIIAVDRVSEAIPLPEFDHPDHAFYVFGGEDRTLNAEILDWSNHIVSIPTPNYDGSLNLAMAVNIILYDRFQKQLDRARPSTADSGCGG